jgi:DNA-binding LytR/AlgR family response regulator
MNTKPTPRHGFINVATQVRRAVAFFRLSVVRRWSRWNGSSGLPSPGLAASEPEGHDQAPLDRRSLGAATLDQRPSSALAGLKAPTPLERLAVKSNGRVVFVKIEEIDWIGAADNYVELHVGKESHLLREKLSTLETRLAPEKFVRISRSTIVNIERLKELQSLPRGAYAVILQDGTELKLCRNYREKLKQFGLR